MIQPGRWNPSHVPVLYTSASVSLACLEVLVHLEKTEWPEEFVLSWADLPVDPHFLPFIDFHDLESTRTAGEMWVRLNREVAVLVPSVIIASRTGFYDHNVLLNPLHRDFAALAWSEPEPFVFDKRLFFLTGAT